MAIRGGSGWLPRLACARRAVRRCARWCRRLTMLPRIRVLFALTLAASGCRMDAEERRQVVESARESERTIAASDIVRELLSSSDPGRLIYSQPTALAAR